MWGKRIQRLQMFTLEAGAFGLEDTEEEAGWEEGVIISASLLLGALVEKRLGMKRPPLDENVR